MEIAELKAFAAVAEYGSFSEAAKQLHITQPAISKRIAHLESRLSQPLFDRIGHSINLTEAGQRLLPHTHTILNTINDSIHEVTQLSSRPAGKLRIATSYHIGLHYLPGLLKSYAADYPDVELDINFMDSEDAIEGIEKGNLELAVVTLPMTISESLKTQLLWQDPMNIVCANDHPLAESTDSRNLSQYPAILPDRHTFTRQIVEKVFSDIGQSINVRLSSNHLESIRMMVEIGFGWSVLPATLASDSLHICKYDALSFSRQLGIITHRQRTLSRSGMAMIEKLQSNDATPQ